MTLATRVTHIELQRAWRALEAGIFREEIPPTPELGAAANQPPAVATVFTGPVVVVAGCHGWAGTSTTTLMVAEAYARRGTPVRILDAAPAARSGFPAAAATEHGLDETGRWRLGSRGRVAVHRSAGSPASVLEVPVPPAVTEGTVTVVDAGWPIAALLAPSPYAHWLPRSLRHSPLLLAARPSVPGLRHVEVTLELLPPSARPHVLLLGARRRWLQAATGELLLAAERDGRVHLVPEHGDLAAAGLTPGPLPRQLHRVADHLTELTAPDAPHNPPVAAPVALAAPRTRTISLTGRTARHEHHDHSRHALQRQHRAGSADAGDACGLPECAAWHAGLPGPGHRLGQVGRHRHHRHHCTGLGRRDWYREDLRDAARLLARRVGVAVAVIMAIVFVVSSR